VIYIYIYDSLKKLVIGLRFKFQTIKQCVGEPYNVRQDRTKSNRGSLWIGEAILGRVRQYLAEPDNVRLRLAVLGDFK
jgi:hypothetical protein